MNLKGYNFYDVNNKLQASFSLKDLILTLYQEIDKIRLIEIVNHLGDNGFEIHGIVKFY